MRRAHIRSAITKKHTYKLTSTHTCKPTKQNLNFLTEYCPTLCGSPLQLKNETFITVEHSTWPWYMYFTGVHLNTQRKPKIRCVCLFMFLFFWHVERWTNHMGWLGSRGFVFKYTTQTSNHHYVDFIIFLFFILSSFIVIFIIITIIVIVERIKNEDIYKPSYHISCVYRGNANANDFFFILFTFIARAFPYSKNILFCFKLFFYFLNRILLYYFYWFSWKLRKMI